MLAALAGQILGLSLFFIATSAASSLRLGKPAPLTGLSSQSQRFPEDILAQPAYQVKFDDETVSNQTAQHLLAGEAYPVEVQRGAGQPPPKRPSRHYLMHASPTLAYLCSLSEPSFQQPPSSAVTLTPANLLEERHRVIESGLSLLEPLKGTCLYHTLDWFTYSLCFGEGIRQFRAAEKTVGPGRVPSPDPNQDAYMLGRWRDELEVVGGRHPRSDSHGRYPPRNNQEDRLQELSTKLGISPDEVVSRSLSPSSSHQISDLLDTSDDENGTELMQLILFSSNSLEQRYLSQTWSDGTLCDINHEPRSVEVQYHCVPDLERSRIALIKETTTCKYVLVVETPLTCQEKELSVGRDEGAAKARIGEWRCRKVVEGDADGLSSVVDGSQSDASATQDAARRADQAPLPDKFDEETADSQSQDDWSSEPLLDVADSSQTSGRYFAAGLDEEGNVVVEEVDGWEAQLLANEAGTASGEAGSPSNGEPANLSPDAALQEVLHGLLDQVAQGQANQDPHLGQQPIELQLTQEEFMTLLGGDGEVNGQAGVGLDAQELQGAIARSLETELRKLQERKKGADVAKGESNQNDPNAAADRTQPEAAQPSTVGHSGETQEQGEQKEKKRPKDEL